MEFEPGTGSPPTHPSRKGVLPLPTGGRQRPGARFRGGRGRLVPPPPPAPPVPPPGSLPHPAQTAPDWTASTGRSAGALNPRGTPAQLARPVQPPARPIGEWSPTAAVASQPPPAEPPSLPWL